MLHFSYIKLLFVSFLSLMLTQQFILKMLATTTDSPRVESVIKFSNENILQYLQELVGITNQTGIHAMSTAKIFVLLKSRKTKGRRVPLEHCQRGVLFDVKTMKQTDPLFLHLKIKRVTFPHKIVYYLKVSFLIDVITQKKIYIHNFNLILEDFKTTFFYHLTIKFYSRNLTFRTTKQLNVYLFSLQ